MLKGIPKIIPPELLKILDEMGHGDQLVIADGNFPAESIGKNAHVVRLDGLGGLEVLTAILQLVPLDQYDETPIRLMEVVPGDPVKTPIWDEYKAEIRKNDNRGDAVVGLLERFAFYDAARQAYCVIATGESAQYANILLRKGVIA
jgi:L-fucose mutarotase